MEIREWDEDWDDDLVLDSVEDNYDVLTGESEKDPYIPSKLNPLAGPLAAGRALVLSAVQANGMSLPVATRFMPSSDFSVEFWYSPVSDSSNANGSLFSFVCVYVLAVLVAERLEGKAGRIARDAAVTGMLLLVIVNVYFANEVYLKLYLEYENAFATWSETVAQIRQTEGFDENMYLDAATRTKVEETGGANFLFITKDGKVVTPKSNSILPSITRRSLIYVAEHYLGLEVEEREVFFDEVKDFAECGLCGTAAVISPVGKIYDHGNEICFPSGMEEMGPITKKLYETLTGIQMGTIEAPEGWIVEI